MKNLNFLDKYRVEHPVAKSMGDETCGLFRIFHTGIIFMILASCEAEWEHVSVSLWTKRGTRIDRCPTWDEMVWVKDLLFEEDEVVMQIHPKKEDYVNLAKNCLHLWKPVKEKIPTPPVVMV